MGTPILEEHISLHDAVKSMDLEVAELLLRNGTNIYLIDEKGMTPLHILVQQRIEMCNSLHAIEKKDSTDSICKKIEQNEKLIGMLLKHANNDYHYIEDMQLFNFCVACTMKNSSIAEKLLDQIVDINQCINTNSPVFPSYTALHFAAHFNINIVEMLITKGANLMAKDAKGITPLDICIQSFRIKDVHSILTSVPAWRNILFSDGQTKLLDYIYSLQNIHYHNTFLCRQSNGISISLSKTSPLWPGSTILHLAVTFLSNCNLEMIKKILYHSADSVTIQDNNGSTPVHLAFRQNKLEFVELLLKYQKEVVNPLDEDNLSHLHIAVAVNNQTVTKRLLKFEGNIDISYRGKPLPTVKQGYTPLHTAANTKHAVVAKMLLNRGANLLQTDARGFTAIHLLFGAVYTNMLAELFFASKQLKEFVVEGVGLTHLHVATWKDNPEAIDRLLASGADIEAIIGKLEDEDLKKFEGWRSIHVALIDTHHLGAFKTLMQRGANILARKLNGSSVLSELLTGKYYDKYLEATVDYLWNSDELQKRLKKEMGITILHIVCYTIDFEKLQNLLKKEVVDINTRIHDDSSIWPGFTPLHVLVFVGLNLEHNRSCQQIVDVLLRLLLSKGADVTLSNTEGETPVHLALKARYKENGNARASLLMDHHKDFSNNPMSKSSMSHFHVACLLNKTEAIKEFLSQGSHVFINHPIDSSDNSRFAGQTPLLLALSCRIKNKDGAKPKIESVNLLLKQGANVHVVDAFGWTPLHKLATCTFTRKNLFDQVLIDDSDINKQTIDGKSPVEILLLEGASVEELEYFIQHGSRINAYNPISDVGYLAIIVSTRKNRKLYDFIFKNMIESPDIAEVDESGRNAIHNLVSVDDLGWGISEDDYHVLIEKLITVGCNIYQQDSQGRTALHLAVKFRNIKAIKLLLKCGADVNIVDSTGQSPLFYALKPYRNKKYPDSYDFNIPVCALIAKHLRKLQFVGLEVSKLNAKLLNTMMHDRIEIEVEIRQATINDQLKKTAEIKIGQSGFTVRDFLYQTDAVNLYLTADRNAINLFFKPLNDRRFWALWSLLKLQYRKALERSSLIAPAVNALRILLGFPLPDLCVQIILKFLTNIDFKNMTAAIEINGDTDMIID